MTERIYPQREDSNILRLDASAGIVTVSQLDVWELDPSKGAG